MNANGKLLLEAYPLQWPAHQPRKLSHQRRRAAFKVSLGHARDELLDELRLLGARDVIITSNVATRRDGLPYADAREPSDPGVAVYFERPFKGGKAQQYVFACDTFDLFLHNLRAVGMTVAALRAIQRYGATEMLEQAFTGFAALPPGGRVTQWWEVLGVPPRASVAEITAAHRELVMIHHPDRGGDSVRMAEINAARDAALSALASNGEGAK